MLNVSGCYRRLDRVAGSLAGLCGVLSVGMIVALVSCHVSAQEATTTKIDNFRRPASDNQLERWLKNMVWHHQFSHDEITAATGLTESEISAALKRFAIDPAQRPSRASDAPLLTLPYPGGRHPRIGFLDGAIRPQRETKISVFAPWDATSYVVLDIPEAIWSNLGLTYLAHTHVPTIFDKRGVVLEKLEWEQLANHTLHHKRSLPNGIEFETTVRAHSDHVEMKMSLKNGTDETLSDLRVQNCAMLKAAKGFNAQTNENKIFQDVYATCHSDDGQRWIILGWTPIHRPWGNAPCPCLHADPKFEDCPPGETRSLRGWFSFFEGSDIRSELARIDRTGWRTAP